MDHIEQENNDLRTKLNKLQEAIVSPSGDAKSSAIARLVSENPAPRFLENSPPTPKTAIKSCGIVGLQRKPRSPCKNLSNNMKRTLSNQETEPISLFSKKNRNFHLNLSQKLFTMASVGIQNLTIFLVQKKEIGYSLSRKPKGVAKPKVDQKMKTIKSHISLNHSL